MMGIFEADRPMSRVRVLRVRVRVRAGKASVLDIKGEAFRATAGHRRAMGQEAYHRSALSPDPERSHSGSDLMGFFDAQSSLIRD